MKFSKIHAVLVLTLLLNPSPSMARWKDHVFADGDYRTIEKAGTRVPHDYEYALCGPYDIVRCNYREVVFCLPEEKVNEVVTGNVVKFAINEPYVAGLAERSFGDTSPEASELAGYFLVNTKTRVMLKGLSEKKWRMELSRIGWNYIVLNAPL